MTVLTQGVCAGAGSSDQMKARGTVMAQDRATQPSANGTEAEDEAESSVAGPQASGRPAGQKGKKVISVKANMSTNSEIGA